MRNTEFEEMTSFNSQTQIRQENDDAAGKHREERGILHMLQTSGNFEPKPHLANKSFSAKSGSICSKSGE